MHQVQCVENSPERRRLLGLVADLLISNGLHGLSLSGIARSIGSNNRMLLYYFESLDKMLHEASRLAMSRFPKVDRIFTRLAEQEDFQVRLERVWDDISDPENLPFLRFFFQMVGRALYERSDGEAFLTDVRTTWSASLIAVFRAEGYTLDAAHLAATQLLAMWRGLQVALVAGDDPRLLTGAYRSSVRSLLPCRDDPIPKI
jgi:AcrR family transcriptional regulator